MVRIPAFLAALLLCGACSINVADEVHDSVGAIACGWVDKLVYTLPKGDACWSVTASSGFSFTPVGADSCDAKDGQGTSVWRPGDQVVVWSKVTERGDSPPMQPVRVDCPSE